MRIITLLTLSRIALSPFIVAALLTNERSLALVLIIIAILTDIFDGHFARIRGETSRTGAWLDPLADKLVIIPAFLAIAFRQNSPWLFAAIFLLIFREAGITILRALVPDSSEIKASPLAKLKTTIENAAIIALILMPIIGQILTWISVAIAYLSAIEYLRAWGALPATHTVHPTAKV